MSNEHRPPPPPPSAPTVSPERAGQPPEAPRLRPRFRMHRNELAGLLVIAVLPFLAIMGIFGPRAERARAWSSALVLDVEYPGRFRRGMTQRLEATVSNRSPVLMPKVTLRFERAYLGAFGVISVMPDVTEPYVIELPNLQSGESRPVVIELEAERYGRHRGQLTATYGSNSVAATLTTLVFP